MAHFYKPRCKCKGKRCRCNSSWAYIMDVGTDPKTGKRKQKKKSGFKTKKELSEGVYVKESDITFEQFAYEWLIIYQQQNNVKESTVRIRKHEIKRLLDYFAKIKLSSITRHQYQHAINDLKERGYALNTLKGAYRTGRMIFKKAIELDLLKKDITEFTYIPREQKSIDEIEGNAPTLKYLEKDELKLFLSTAQTYGLSQDYPIFLLLAYTGMRIGELCALKWSDIDIEHHTISVTKTYYNPNNNRKNYKLFPPKTSAGIRDIDVDDTVIKALKKHKIKQNVSRLIYSNTYYNENFVFANDNEMLPGYPYYIKKISTRMSRLLKLANLNNSLTLHSLRHTHTSLLAEADVSLPQIMERLGHKDESTTRDIYLHVTKQRKKEASQKFKNLMENLL